MHTSSRPPLQTILCDMGNVLVFFCHERMCRQIGELCGRSPSDVREHLLDSSLQWEFERGFISEEKLLSRLEEILECRLNQTDLVRATADIFELNASLPPVLRALKQQGLRLVLLSNTCVSHVNFIRKKWDFLDLFDHLIFSYEVGAIKPEDAIYAAALKEIHCRPEECLYVDDIAAYVDQGRLYGLNAEVFTTTAAFVEKLSEYGIHLPDRSSCSNLDPW